MNAPGLTPSPDLQDCSPGGLPIILVDDDASVLFSTEMVLRSAGLDAIETLSDSRDLLPLLTALHTENGCGAAAVILDLTMPHFSGMELLPEIVLRFPDVPVLVMTATDDVQTAVACMQEGAADFLVKPVEENRFVTSVRKILEVRALRHQVGALKRSLLSDHLEYQDAFEAIVTSSRKMRALFQYVESIAFSEEPVLITGETGVGKELVASAIARISGRQGPMVAINVAGLDDAMVSDTLFGHRKGAYSGAEENRQGLVSEAKAGTLFLDEIGDLGASTQVKLLRLLQERKFYPLGSDVPLRSQARILCATNQDLRQRMLEGHFRTDLYYRLLVHHVEVPPLRERREDLPSLTLHFLEEAAHALGKKIPTPPPELFTLLQSYPFPGNIRQLRALIYDATARHRSGLLSMDSFRALMTPPTSSSTSDTQTSESMPHGDAHGVAREMFRHTITGTLPTLKAAEQGLIQEALRRAQGNQGIAAGFLGISRQALNQRLRRKNKGP